MLIGWLATTASVLRLPVYLRIILKFLVVCRQSFSVACMTVLLLMSVMAIGRAATVHRFLTGSRACSIYAFDVVAVLSLLFRVLICLVVFRSFSLGDFLVAVFGAVWPANMVLIRLLRVLTRTWYGLDVVRPITPDAVLMIIPVRALCMDLGSVLRLVLIAIRRLRLRRVSLVCWDLSMLLIAISC